MCNVFKHVTQLTILGYLLGTGTFQEDHFGSVMWGCLIANQTIIVARLALLGTGAQCHILPQHCQGSLQKHSSDESLAGQSAYRHTYQFR